MSAWFKNGGEAHRGYFNNIWCDSSWELALLIYCIDHKIQIVRNSRTFPYKFGKKICGYKPDFIINGNYVEVKGVKDYRSKRKLQQFPFPIKIIDKKEIKKYLQYAENKYGKDFWKLLKK